MIPMELMQALQTIAIVGGIVILVAKIGGREQLLRDSAENIRELRETVTQLAATVTGLATNHENTAKSLDEIRRRLERLEARDR